MSVPYNMKQRRSGEILKEKRLEKKLSLEDVEKETKIRTKFLKALEDGNTTAVSHSYARGFLKNYAEFLGLEASLLLALFRRETEKQNQVVLPNHLTGRPSLFRLTPTRGIIIAVAIFLLGIIFVIYQQYQGYLGAPKLTIDSPQEDVTVTQDTVVSGKTDPDASVLVNSDPVSLDQDGKFTKTLHLFAGDTTITVTSQNRRGKQTVITRHIHVK